MTNLFFKSAPTYKKFDLELKVNLIQKELRQQRNDLSVILNKLEKLINNDNLQKTVDEYYESHPDSELEDK